MRVPLGKSHRAYRHEALLYRGMQGFLDAVVPFIREGVQFGQPVMVAVSAPKILALQAELGADADAVCFVDMAEMGKNPARIIPAWRAFVESRNPPPPGPGDAPDVVQPLIPVRGVGEPIWAGRRQSELVEAQFHEALLNLAVAPDTPLWLLCPYDVDALGADVIEEAQRSHPALVDAEHYRGSTTYGGAYHVGAVFGRELPPPVGPVRNLVVTDNNGPEIAGWIRRWAEGSGLSNERSGRLATALRAICLTSASRAGRSEVLQMWQEGSALICQIHDVGHVQDPLIGRRPDGTESERGKAIRLANQLCDLVQVRSGAAGTTIRVHSWL
jgi:hypothetical protein